MKKSCFLKTGSQRWCYKIKPFFNMIIPLLIAIFLFRDTFTTVSILSPHEFKQKLTKPSVSGVYGFAQNVIVQPNQRIPDQQHFEVNLTPFLEKSLNQGINKRLKSIDHRSSSYRKKTPFIPINYYSNQIVIDKPTTIKLNPNNSLTLKNLELKIVEEGSLIIEGNLVLENSSISLLHADYTRMMVFGSLYLIGKINFCHEILKKEFPAIAMTKSFGFDPKIIPLDQGLVAVGKKNILRHDSSTVNSVTKMEGEILGPVHPNFFEFNLNILEETS